MIKVSLERDASGQEIIDALMQSVNLAEYATLRNKRKGWRAEEFVEDHQLPNGQSHIVPLSKGIEIYPIELVRTNLLSSKREWRRQTDTTFTVQPVTLAERYKEITVTMEHRFVELSANGHPRSLVTEDPSNPEFAHLKPDLVRFLITARSLLANQSGSLVVGNIASLGTIGSLRPDPLQ